MRYPNIIAVVFIFIGLPFNASAQSCQVSIVATAPDYRYSDNGDGTITDNGTGLVWKQCSEGQSGVACNTGAASVHTWQAALQIPQTINTGGGYAGHTDWRLPNIKELASLVEERCESPAINLNFFPNTVSSYYWSSSPYPKFSYMAWWVDFVSGSADTFHYYDAPNGRADRHLVRLVRGGQ